MVVTLLFVATLAAAPSAAKGAAKHERMTVHDVLVMPDGQHAVVLRSTGEPARLLPIWIGETEAMAIRMRLDRSKPPRPLTLHLLESVLQSAGIRLLEVKVDGLRNGVFLGKLRLRQGTRTWEVDARPSDAIGLAVAQDVAIWVAREVIDEAGLSGDALPPADRAAPNATPPAGGAGPEGSQFEETL
jgi:hypothetical protein